MKITPFNESVTELDLVFELTIDKPLPNPLDGRLSVYQRTDDSLIQVLVVDGVEEITLIELEGEPRERYLLDIVEREGAEALIANAYIDYEVETFGMFRGAAHIPTFQTERARRAMAELTLGIEDKVLVELHDALTTSGSSGYPLNRPDGSHAP